MANRSTAATSGAAATGTVGGGPGVAGSDPNHRPAGDPMSTMREMRDKAEDEAEETATGAKGRIRAVFEQQTHRAADQLDTVAHALHSAAEQLNEENAGAAARYTDAAAHQVEEVAEIIRTATVDDMVGRVETFARRNPEVFVGAAFGIGFLLARFVKSSGERRDRAAALRGRSGMGTERGGLGGTDRTGGADIAGAYAPAGTARPGGAAT